jgi:hypothetical protein
MKTKTKKQTKKLILKYDELTVLGIDLTYTAYLKWLVKLIKALLYDLVVSIVLKGVMG